MNIGTAPHPARAATAPEFAQFYGELVRQVAEGAGVPIEPLMKPIMTKPTKSWQQLKEPMAYVAVQGIAVDPRGHFLMIHRGPNLRSARDCWSLPGGLHDIGLTVEENIVRELEEEVGLGALPGNAQVLGCYENITDDGEDGQSWHWFVVVLSVLVDDVRAAVNREPDKHDGMRTDHLSVWGDPQFYVNHPFHPAFTTWALPRGVRIMAELSSTSRAGARRSR